MGDKERDPRESALSPIRTIFGHGFTLCNVSLQNSIIFCCAIATVMSRVSIVTCYGNRAKTPSRDLYNIKP